MNFDKFESVGSFPLTLNRKGMLPGTLFIATASRHT